MSIRENHRGGVVRVKRPPGESFSVVPRPLLLDRRIGLAARAVAAYLVGQDVSWQIAIAPMCAVLGLSKDRWQSIARELESAGYLMRAREKGVRGEWVWNITFDHSQGLAQAAAGAGSSMAGKSSHGSSGDGESSHKEEKGNNKSRKPKSENQNLKPDTARLFLGRGGGGTK